MRKRRESNAMDSFFEEGGEGGGGREAATRDGSDGIVGPWVDGDSVPISQRPFVRPSVRRCVDEHRPSTW